MIANEVDLKELGQENLDRVKLYSTQQVSKMYIREIFNE